MDRDAPNSSRRTLFPTQQRAALLSELQQLGQTQEALRRWNTSSSSQGSRNSQSLPQFRTAPAHGRGVAIRSDLGTANRELTALALSQLVGPNQDIGSKTHGQQHEEEQPQVANTMNSARSGDDMVQSLGTLLNSITRDGPGLSHRLPQSLQGQNSPGRTVAERIQPSWGRIASQSRISKVESRQSSKDTSDEGDRLRVPSLLRRKRRTDANSISSNIFEHHQEQGQTLFSKKKKRSFSTLSSSYSAALNGTLNDCSFPLPRLAQVPSSQLSKKDEGHPLESTDQTPSTQPLKQQQQQQSRPTTSDSNSGRKIPHPTISTQNQAKMLDSRFEEINRSDDDCID
mmetsp:Transcript_60903/g.149120  ORF Transcript_60903/g.149120 Transcript_60903/m.149120 type:complete len:343 (+) Transcript_60903:419-1447(+)